MPVHLGTAPAHFTFYFTLMCEQFVCPVCGENLPYVYFDPEASYWCDTDTGDLVIILNGCLWAVRPGESMFSENNLEKLHGHD